MTPVVGARCVEPVVMLAKGESGQSSIHVRGDENGLNAKGAAGRGRVAVMQCCSCGVRRLAFGGMEGGGRFGRNVCVDEGRPRGCSEEEL